MRLYQPDFAGFSALEGFISNANLNSIDSIVGQVVLRAKLGEPNLLPRKGSRPKPIVYPRVDDAQLIESIAPFPASTLSVTGQGERNQELLQKYYDAILDWAKVVTTRFQPVPDHSDWGYFGDPNHKENSIRPLTYAVMTYAFISQVEPPQEKASAEFRKQTKGEAIAILRYLTYAHRAGGGTCLHGKPWGGGWQSAMWTRSFAVGGWLLWDELDRPMKLAVARVVEFEADRFIAKPPKSSLLNDTGAEENAWNSGLLAMAAVMMPDHPRTKLWDEAAKRYMYNTFSVKADKQDRTIGDDGRAVSDWVTTLNAHGDYTVENHGLVHVGYLKNSHRCSWRRPVHTP